MKMPQRAEGLKPASFNHDKARNDAVPATRNLEVEIAAEFLVEVMGDDVAAAFFARFGSVMVDACRRAEDLAHVRRAEDGPEVELPASQVRRVKALHDLPSSEDEPRVRALAAKIKRGEELDPIVVMLRPKACCSYQPYELISGWEEFRAFVDVLGRNIVPVQIAPPVPPETLTLFDNLDA